jgi:hypothetical protein
VAFARCSAAEVPRHPAAGSEAEDEAVSTTVVTTAASAYDVGLRHYHLDVRGSAATDGDVTDGWGEWWVVEDGEIVAGEEEFLVLDFAPIAFAGVDRRAYVRFVDRAGNAGEFVEVVLTAEGAATFVQYVDTGGSNGNAGTSSGSPVQTIAQAFANVDAQALDDGEVAVIYLRRGQTHSYSATVHSPQNTRQVLYVLDAYDSGARPKIDGPGSNTAFLSMGAMESVHLRSVEWDGNGDGEMVVSARTTGSRTGGLNLMLHDSRAHNGRTGVRIQDSSVTAANRGDGRVDFFAIVDSTLETCSEYQVYQEAGLRRVLIDGYTSGADASNSEAGQNIFRVQKWQNVFARDWTATPTNNASLRLGTIPAESASSADFFGLASFVRVTVNGVDNFQNSIVWSHDGTPLGGDRGYLRDARLVACRLNRATFKVDGDITVDRLQFWNCELADSFFEIGKNTSTLGMLNSVEILDCASSAGRNFVRIQNPSAQIADDAFTLLGNVYHSTDSDGSNRSLIYADIGGGNLLAADLVRVLGACDYNHLGSTSGTHALLASFGDSPWARNLSSWQGATSFDDNSTSAVSTATMGFVDIGTSGAGFVDADFHAASASLGAGWPRAYSIDADGHLRGGTPDAGPYQFGATATPDEPDLGGGEVVGESALPTATWSPLVGAAAVDMLASGGLPTAAWSPAVGATDIDMLASAGLPSMSWSPPSGTADVETVGAGSLPSASWSPLQGAALVDLVAGGGLQSMSWSPPSSGTQIERRAPQPRTGRQDRRRPWFPPRFAYRGVRRQFRR